MFNRLMLYAGVALGCHASRALDKSGHLKFELEETRERITDAEQCFNFKIKDRNFVMKFYTPNEQIGLDTNATRIKIGSDLGETEYRLRPQVSGMYAGPISETDPNEYVFHLCGRNRVLCSVMRGGDLRHLSVVTLSALEQGRFMIDFVGLCVHDRNFETIGELPTSERIDTLIALYLAATEPTGVIDGQTDSELVCSKLIFLSDQQCALAVFKINDCMRIVCIRKTGTGVIEVSGGNRNEQGGFRFLVTLPMSMEGYRYDIVKSPRYSNSTTPEFVQVDQYGENGLIFTKDGKRRTVAYQYDKNSVTFSI